MFHLKSTKNHLINIILLQKFYRSSKKIYHIIQFFLSKEKIEEDEQMEKISKFNEKLLIYICLNLKFLSN